MLLRFRPFELIAAVPAEQRVRRQRFSAGRAADCACAAICDGFCDRNYFRYDLIYAIMFFRDQYAMEGTVVRKFSEELDRMIRERSIAIYELAKMSGVERTLIHKMLKGERLPAKPSVVEALADALMLSVDERETLLESYRAAKMGEEAYRSRRAVLDFYNQFPPTASSGIVRETGAGPAYIPPQEAAVRGKTCVVSLLGALLEEEAAGSDGHVRILAQPECAAPFEILAAVAARRKDLTVDHIVCFENSSRERNPLYNLNCLRAMMPIFASGCRYRPRYYYGAAECSGEAGILPYVILTGRRLVRLSRDADYAVVSQCRPFLALYAEIFDAFMEKADPLATVLRTPMEQIGYCGKICDRFLSVNCDFAAVPCLLLFAGREMVLRYINPVFMQSPDDARVILEYMYPVTYGKRLECLTNVYFSKAGIERYLATGRLSELPDEYYSPLDVPDQYRLLRAMYDAILAGTYHACLVDEKKLRVPGNLYTYFFEKGVVGFVYTGSGREYTAITVGEKSIATAIQDFLAYLPESGMVAPKREMMSFLKGKLDKAPLERP